MTEHEAFLDAIIADPADDTPRLMYADWLEERGNAERAEFIRVQIQLAEQERIHRADVEAVDRQQVLGRISRDGATILRTVSELALEDLRRRERELLEAHGKAWVQELLASIRSPT